MPLTRPARLPSLALLLLVVLSGCSPEVVTDPKENLRPTVRFTRAPSRSGDLYSYTYEMFWTGFDPDGQVREYRYAVDPPTPTTFDPDPDTVWVSTLDNRATFQFTAEDPQPPVVGEPRLSVSYHLVVLKAVDNRGLASAPAVVAFNASTVAPAVRILSPPPSSRFRQLLPPAITIQWDGSDEDAGFAQKPVYYRIKLLSGSTPITPTMWMANPDTVIRYYQPRDWATWDSLGGNVSQFSYSSLAPDQEYCFVIVAFDEAGAYTPYANGDSNVLNFRVRYAASGGPLLTMFNEFFTYTYASAAYAPHDPRYAVRLEVPGDVPLRFQWSATAQEGTDIRYFRWVLDPEDLLDESPRTNERTDVNHWSQANLTVRSCDLPAFGAPGDHRLYIEVGDGNGLKSLGVIHFQVVVATFEKPLAIVDDTRLLVDRRSPGATSCIDRPLGRFPTAAELDTFLYARGWVPIRCYPAGSVSRPGVFWGYSFDTLNTRIGQVNLTPSLSVLSRYRHLVWLVDAVAADNNEPGSNLIDGSTALRFMNSVGNLNALAAFIRQGGQVWFAGGGTMAAAAAPFNTNGNDRPSKTYSAAFGELRAGRFVYDVPHWRSEFQPVAGVLQVRRSLGRHTAAPGVYAMLPATMDVKSLAAGDSMPAWRTNPGDFYQSSIKLDALTKPNPILEDMDPDEEVVRLESVMDTLYSVSGGTLPPNSTAMTLYHGTENSRIIVTGFDLWTYRKSQLVQLVDAVLQGIWGLSRSPGPQP